MDGTNGEKSILVQRENPAVHGAEDGYLYSYTKNESKTAEQILKEEHGYA